jgi:hypothetical protein
MAVTTRDVVAQALGGRRFDIRGYLFEGCSCWRSWWPWAFS